MTAQPTPQEGPGRCPHPLARTVVRDEFYVWCWACQSVLSRPEAWLVVRRWQALDHEPRR